MPDVSEEDLFEMLTLVHRRWAEEFDTLKAVKVETGDGSTDWAAFHAHRLHVHTEREATWKALLQRNAAKVKA